MGLVTPEYARLYVATKLTDVEIQAVLDQIELEVVRLFGPHYIAATPRTLTTRDPGTQYLYMPRRFDSISGVTVDAVALTVDTDYELWTEQVTLRRLPAGSTWSGLVIVTYQPSDDSPMRKGVIVEVLRLMLERTSMMSESVQDQYRYQAPPNWDALIAKQYRRLKVGYGG